MVIASLTEGAFGNEFNLAPLMPPSLREVARRYAETEGVSA